MGAAGQPADAGTAALFTHAGYRYTLVTIANGAVPRTVEVELWYASPVEVALGSGWKYFGQRAALDAAAARACVEDDFKAWVEGRAEAETRLHTASPSPSADRCRRCGTRLTRNDFEDECEPCRKTPENQ